MTPKFLSSTITPPEGEQCRSYNQIIKHMEPFRDQTAVLQASPTFSMFLTPPIRQSVMGISGLRVYPTGGRTVHVRNLS